MNFVLSSDRLHRARRARAVGRPHRRRGHLILISVNDSHLDLVARVSWGFGHCCPTSPGLKR